MTAVAAPLAQGSLKVKRKLENRELYVLFAVVVAAVVVLWLVTPLHGIVSAIVVAGLVYAVAQSALSFAVEGRRQAVDRLAGLGIRTSLLLAVAPLLGVLGYTVQQGVDRLNLSFLSSTMEGVTALGDARSARGTGPALGGAEHAIIGTLEQVAIASLISIPLGLLVAVYVTEYGTGRLASYTRFAVDVMTGVPSIVSGLFVYAFLVIGLGYGPNGFAGGIALSILMLPVVMRSSEEMIKLVPDSLREAAYAMGVPKWKTILKIVLPTASAGIVTGVMLAVARVTGETAPIVLVVQGLSSTNSNPFDGKQSGLGLFIYQQASTGTPAAVARAWAAGLTLIVIVLVLYAGARFITRKNVLTR